MKTKKKLFLIKKKVSKKLLIILLLLGFIIFNVSSIVYQQRERYFSRNYWQRYKELDRTYWSSQYVSKHPKGWIADETVNAYAGGAYIKGVNPILIAADTPPLGRYLIGFSSFLFGNENIVIIFFGILSLFAMYLLASQVFSSKIISLLLPAVFSFEPIFKNQLFYVPLLDIIQLPFLLLSLYFFNYSLIKKNNKLGFILTSVFLGLFISTKFFITGFTVIAAYYSILLLNKKKKLLLPLTLSLPISAVILLLSYVRVLSFGYNLQRFIGIQKWVFLYHKSQLILPFSIWPLILFNKWHVWWGNIPILSDPQWLITWPIITIFSFLTIFLYLFKKINKQKTVEVLMAWIIFYFLFFSFGQITTRYFVILIPILYIIAMFGLKSLYEKYFLGKRS